MVSVPLFADGSDAAISDGLVTVGTFGAAEFFVTSLTSRGTVELEKETSTDGRTARATSKMLWVISGSERLYDLSVDGLLAGSTDLLSTGSSVTPRGRGEGRLYSGDVVHLTVEIVE